MQSKTIIDKLKIWIYHYFQSLDSLYELHWHREERVSDQEFPKHHGHKTHVSFQKHFQRNQKHSSKKKRKMKNKINAKNVFCRHVILKKIKKKGKTSAVTQH